MGSHGDDAAANYRVQVEIGHWLAVDGAMEHEVKRGIDTGDRSRVALGGSIRRAGWDQIPDWPHDAAGFATWPAPGQTTTISLSAAQWGLVVSGLEWTADVDDSLGIPEHTDMAATARIIAALIRARLTEQGWPPS